MSSAQRVLELLTAALPAEIVERFETRDGVPACPLVAPRTPAEAAEVVNVARGERWTVLPLGTGSKLAWARAPERVDLVLSSKNLRGVTAYEPADGTLSARAGTPWAELEATVRAAHHLSPEVAGAAHATLGGVLGAGASGLDRLRHGPLRHHVLGIQALHADGTSVKSGGRVVKNVTGYDLHRLWCGSQGTLCFLLEATLRLQPAPAEVACLRARSTWSVALERSHALWRAGLQPLAALVRGAVDADACTLDVLLAGRAEAVASEVTTARAALPDAEVLWGDAARAARAELRELELRNDAWSPLVVACRPSRLAGALERMRRACAELELEAKLVCHPLLATAAVDFTAGAPSAARSAELERALADAELNLRWRGAGLRSAARPTAAADALMRRLKESLDPQGVFVRGRFHDGL